MKYIKTFENVKEPQIGDYVLCYQFGLINKEIENFINSSLGKIVNIYNNNINNNKMYVVEYKNVPKNLLQNSHFYKYQTPKRSSNTARNLSRNEIIFWNKDKELVKNKIEIINNVKKYNL